MLIAIGGVIKTIFISDAVLKKLETKHNVSAREVEMCFENKYGGLLEDTREKHATTPLTLWFIAETNQRRRLKICFIPYPAALHIKSAYEPNAEEIRIYDKCAFGTKP